MAGKKKKRSSAKSGGRRAKTARRNSKLLTSLLAAFLVLAILAGLSYYFFIYRKRGPGGESGTPPAVFTGEISLHFLELGNKYAGDCILIKAGDTEVLIDGGSREQSADAIERYVNRFCTDGILEYVIVTHADQDHIAAFAGNKTYPSLFERYECRTIVDFPLTDKNTQTYAHYCASRDAEVKAGAVHYTALQCYRETGGAKRSYALAEGVTLEFLYNYYYEHRSSDENNYSVCFLITQGTSRYLFTGDLEKDGEKRLVEGNDLPRCKLFKAGHHGSNTSSTEELLSVIRPEYVCICCCAGSPEYTGIAENTFPTKGMLDRVLHYTRQIFVTSLATDVDLEKREWNYTSMNGDIMIVTDGVNFTVQGSKNSVPLPDTDWYAANRAG